MHHDCIIHGHGAYGSVKVEAAVPARELRFDGKSGDCRKREFDAWLKKGVQEVERQRFGEDLDLDFPQPEQVVHTSLHREPYGGGFRGIQTKLL